MFILSNDLVFLEISAIIGTTKKRLRVGKLTVFFEL